LPAGENTDLQSGSFRKADSASKRPEIMAIAIVSRRTSRSPSEAAYSGDASDIKLDYIEASGGIVMSETMDSDWTFSSQQNGKRLN
jgi:hypothetical protein